MTSSGTRNYQRTNNFVADWCSVGKKGMYMKWHENHMKMTCPISSLRKQCPWKFSVYVGCGLALCPLQLRPSKISDIHKVSLNKPRIPTGETAEWPTYVLNLVEFGGVGQQALAFTLYKDGLMESAWFQLRIDPIRREWMEICVKCGNSEPSEVL
jgi:hypothetical protein